MARSLKNKETSKNIRLEKVKYSGRNQQFNHGFTLPEFIYRYVSPEQIKNLVLDSAVRIEHRRD